MSEPKERPILFSDALTHLAPLPPAAELQEIDAALARVATCPRMHPRVQEILRGRRAAVEQVLRGAPPQGRNRGR